MKKLGVILAALFVISCQSAFFPTSAAQGSGRSRSVNRGRVQQASVGPVIAGSVQWIVSEHCTFRQAVDTAAQIAAPVVQACPQGLCASANPYAYTIHIVPTKDVPTRWLVFNKAFIDMYLPPPGPTSLWVYASQSYDGTNTYTDVGVSMNMHNRGSFRGEGIGEEIVWGYTDGAPRAVCP